ncbi:MAG TPA: sensor histidine kinase [Myxococcales bacterium]|nr:sensor histidine kinase [Myxococcales bacterium]
MSAPDNLIGRIPIESAPSGARRSNANASFAHRGPMLSLQEAIDGLPEEIAILGRTGRVLSANRAWLRAPGPRNAGGLPHPGASYLELWQGMRSREALETARGIRSLIRGTRPRFTCEFRSSHPNRWSELSVTRIDVGNSFNLLVVHRDVTDAERSARALRVLSRRLIRAQEAERRRIARELHDQTAQNLTAISLSLARIELAAPPGDTTMPALLSESRELAQRSVAQLRTLSYLLHPPLLDDEGLVSALRWYVSGFARRSGIRTALRVGRGFGRVPRDVEMALFAVVQECLTNVYRHSSGGDASIRLRRNEQRVVVEVSNRGRRPLSAERRSALQKQQGLGIRSIRERLHVVGGTFELRPGERGVTAIATVPLRRRNHPHAHPHRR